MKSSQHPRSHKFHAARTQHLLEAAEDYTELIQDILEEGEEARIGQLASRLGVSHVTVVRTVRRLAQEGYVIAQHHRPLQLTPLGIKTARKAKEKHSVLVDFLIALGVPRHTAESDAEGIEHHVSGVTLQAMKRFMKRMSDS